MKVFLLTLLGVVVLPRSQAEGPAEVHRYASGAPGIFANAYLVETAHGVVAIDATLTESDSKALRARLDSLNKPLRAVLLTHGHPDHYNGVTNLLQGAPVPVVATAGVDKVIRESDAAKELQWKPTFGAEWPARRSFPSRIVRDGESLAFDGVSFTVHDLGPGESRRAGRSRTLELAARVSGPLPQGGRRARERPSFADRHGEGDTRHPHEAATRHGPSRVPDRARRRRRRARAQGAAVGGSRSAI